MGGMGGAHTCIVSSSSDAALLSERPGGLPGFSGGLGDRLLELELLAEDPLLLLLLLVLLLFW